MSRFTLLTGATMLLFASVSLATTALDVIQFGDARSESTHNLQATRSEIRPGALEQSSRVLLPLEPVSEYGGNVRFDLAVDPGKPTYFTIKLWGGEGSAEQSRLLLLVEGKQVGIRHLGDVDSLDIAAETPRFPGRFTYTTTVLPKAVTAGKSRVRLEIRGLGRVWSYGDTWERFQKPMSQPSRGIYRAYTHTDPFFIPLDDERQGNAPADRLPRTTPGAEVLDEIKGRVNKELEKILAADVNDQMRLQFLAKAYFVKWTPAYQNPKVIDQLIKGMDALYAQFKADPKLARLDTKTWNADWFGFGPMADAIRLLGDRMQEPLGEPIGTQSIRRRDAYAEMFLAARDWHRTSRRWYTNQTMIKDLYGIYLANRGLQVVAPDKAMPEADAKRYLYEAVGLQPWLGNDLPDGGSTKPLGSDYMQLTAKGLTRELGYVGSYGEVADWVTAIYDATRPTPTADGDPKIKEQLILISKARAAFRYPLVDADHHPAMVLETTVGWRDTRHPGYIVYGQRATRDSGPFAAAIATMDPALIGYAQQMISDGQFFRTMRDVMRETMFRVTAGLLETPDAYETLRSLPPSGHRLPMSDGAPDFVFADEENGVVAIKNGDEILYASLYWRARFGVNFLARVHYVTPRIERDATVWQNVKFDDSGMTFTRDDRILEHQTRRHEKNVDLGQAMAGEVLPIAKVPDWMSFKPGQENIYAGRGTFYTLRYGHYTIAMNITADRTFDFAVPSAGLNLVAGKPVSAGDVVAVGPRSTVVFYSK